MDKSTAYFSVGDVAKATAILDRYGVEYSIEPTDNWKTRRTILKINVPDSETLKSIDREMFMAGANPMMESAGSIHFNYPDDWDAEDIAEWEAIQRRKQGPDSDYQEFERKMESSWRSLPKSKEEEIEAMASKRKAAREGYKNLRTELSRAMMNAGIDDFELYGAGRYGESLSPLEYQGALRIIGPPVAGRNFIDVAKNIATHNGYQFAIDRPPSVTHAFGKTVRNGIGLENRPIMYIYKRYHTAWPTSHERELASQAGVSRDENRRLFGHNRIYESKVAEIADEITGNPHHFICQGEALAHRIGSIPEFKLLREEINDAAANRMELERTIHMPLGIGSGNRMVYFLAGSKGGDVMIDLIGCPRQIANKAIPSLSQMMRV